MEYYDGATVKSINIADAVNECKKLVGGDESKVTIDVIMNSGGTFKEKDASKFKAIRMGLRYVEILYYYRSMDLILRAKYAYKNVNFRYVVAPTSSLAGGLLPFSFDAKDIEENINHGIRDAQQVISFGEGKSFDKIIKYTELKTQGKTRQDYGEFL